jgi:N-acyl-D-amino-acid deacylase
VALAVAKDGKLVLARGYGWADVAARRPVQPETRFALASVSKSLTAAAVLKLAEQGRLDLDARVFRELLTDLEPPPGARVDPRYDQITIRMLLYHAGGWDRNRSGDPNTFTPRVSARLGIEPPIHQRDLARFMLGRPLDFDPGTQAVYSNFGFGLFALILPKATGRPYEEVVRELVLKPIGIERVRLDVPPGAAYLPDEAHRYLPEGVPIPAARRGAIPVRHASGGWIGSTPDLVRFVTAIAGTRGTPFFAEAWRERMLAPPPPPVPPRPNGTHFGMGWDVVTRTPRGVGFSKNGGLAGAHTWIEHLPIGVDWAVFWNGGVRPEEDEPTAQARFVQELRAAFRRLDVWPELDLFESLTPAGTAGSRRRRSSGPPRGRRADPR